VYTILPLIAALLAPQCPLNAAQYAAPVAMATGTNLLSPDQNGDNNDWVYVNLLRRSTSPFYKQVQWEHPGYWKEKAGGVTGTAATLRNAGYSVDVNTDTHFPSTLGAFVAKAFNTEMQCALPISNLKKDAYQVYVQGSGLIECIILDPAGNAVASQFIAVVNNVPSFYINNRYFNNNTNGRIAIPVVSESDKYIALSPGDLGIGGNRINSRGGLKIRIWPSVVSGSAITQSNNPNNLKVNIADIRVNMPGFKKSSTQKFHPLFLNSIRAYASTVRTLQWADIAEDNVNEQVSWSNRTKGTWYNQSNNPFGVSLEDQLDLGKELRRDVWIHIPPNANDDYINRMGQLVNQRLSNNDGLGRVWVEFANEIWGNSGVWAKPHQAITAHFAGNHLDGNVVSLAGGYSDLNDYLSMASIPGEYQGNELFSPTNDAVINTISVGHGTTSSNQKVKDVVKVGENTLRTAQVMQRFTSQIAASNRHRLVRVLGAQASNWRLLRQMLYTLQENGINPRNYFDVAAIAPYFGANFMDSNKLYSHDKIYQDVLVGRSATTLRSLPPGQRSTLVNAVLSNDEYVGMNDLKVNTAINAALAGSFGLPLVAYEGGQHFRSEADDENERASLNTLFNWMNESPQMGALYGTTFIPAMKRIGLHSLNLYAHNQNPTAEHGSMGLMPRLLDGTNSDLWNTIVNEAPKLAAVLQWKKDSFNIFDNDYQSFNHKQIARVINGDFSDSDRYIQTGSNKNNSSTATIIAGWTTSGIDCVVQNGQLQLPKLSSANQTILLTPQMVSSTSAVLFKVDFSRTDLAHKATITIRNVDTNTVLKDITLNSYGKKSDTLELYAPNTEKVGTTLIPVRRMNINIQTQQHPMKFDNVRLSL